MLQPLEKFVSDEDMRKHNKTYVTETIFANRKVCYQSLCKPNKHVCVKPCIQRRRPCPKSCGRGSLLKTW